MKQRSLLLLALSLVLLQSCLGAPQVTEPAPNPNGQTAAPEALPSSTPQPTPLPSHLAQLRVAYILEGNVWVWDASTGARQLTSEGTAWHVKISDDGQVIAYQQSGSHSFDAVPAEDLGSSLWAVNADGSNPRKLVSIISYLTGILPTGGLGSEIGLYQFGFQPHSHWLYFNSHWLAGESFIPANDLHRVNADLPVPEALLTSGGGEFDFSLDGRLVSLASMVSINVINADGSVFSHNPPENGLMPAVSYNPLFFNPITYKPQIVWLSNATGFYTVIPFQNGSCSQYLTSNSSIESSKKSCLVYVAADGSAFAQLAEFPAAWSETGQPFISPDGTKVAYAVKNNSTYELHVIDSATIDTIIASYENPPMFELYGWSPDSKRIVFFISDRLFPFAAGIGLPPTPLTESAAPNSLRWLDAERFLFFREGRLLVGQVGTSATFEIAPGFEKYMDNINFYDFALLPSP